MSEELQNKSEIAKAIEKLRDSSIELAKQRSSLPQPLFWINFNAQIDEIRKQKEQQRLFSSALEPLE